MKIYDYEINENNVKSAPDTLKAEGNVTPRDIKHIFDRLPELIAQKFNSFVDYVTGSYYTKEQTESAIALKVTEIGSADMQKSVYDSDGDGVVDTAMSALHAQNAYSLDGYGADHYAVKTEVETAVATVQAAAETAQTTADNAAAAAATAQTTANGKANSSHTQAASTITAGTFPGNVVAYSTNRTASGLRNIEVRTTSATGTLQSTNKIIMVRK